ncbi:hypothetical protein CO669_06975 [Bradyrhizobium sp. Y36]|nr:hypothetical protein CO669_06975 [Bradyrhizobium sp. Y36]
MIPSQAASFDPQPYGPDGCAGDVADGFELDGDSPDMLLVAGVRSDRRHMMSAEEQALFGIDKLGAVRSAFTLD